ncbi:secreted RxLR effector protein 161-like [Nicotiana tomentosiformis]|uniref:secreted RxLR effector protein 161-like n=1 Tax=Nicotiana tomentosiformis TaxID=4098 RepID=UPI00388CAB72
MDVKSVFLNEYIKQEVFVKHPPALKARKVLIMCTNLTRHFMGSSRFQKYGMKDCLNSCLSMATKEANPKESHLTAVKRILRYLKGTTDLCLWYLKGSNFNLVGYVDADYAGFLVDRKSTSGMAHFLGSYLVSWATKKQNSIALSTTEAEYVAAASCCGSNIN